MDRVSVGPVKGLKIAMAALVLSVVLLGVVIAGGLIISQSFTSNLQEALVEGCEHNGNTVRAIFRKRIREEVERGERIAVRQFFPNVPRKELDRLLDEGRKQDERDIRRLHPIDCASRYGDNGSVP